MSERGMCQCIVMHSYGNMNTFDECAFRAKYTIPVETHRFGAEPEPRTIHVCGVHAREIRLGKTVDMNTGKRSKGYPLHWVSDTVRLPKEAK